MKLLTALTFLAFTINTTFAQNISGPEKQLAFFKVWNYVKYFHPALANGDVDADSLFLNKIERIESIKTKNDLNLFISTFLDGLPGSKLTSQAVTKTNSKILRNNSTASWFKSNTLLNLKNKQKLVAIFTNRYIKMTHHYIPDLRYTPEIPNERPYNFPDTLNIPYPFRMLSLAKLQGAVDYLFPHKYLMDQNFDAVLKQKLPAFSDCSTRLEYESLLLGVVSTFNDTHTFKFIDQVKNKEKIFRNSFYPPFKYAVFDDEIVITDIIIPETCNAADIKKGDLVLKINGQTVTDIINALSKRLSISNKPTLRYYLSDYIRNLVWQAKTDSFSLTVKRNGTVSAKNVDFIFNRDAKNVQIITKYLNNSKPKLRDDSNLDIVEGNIAYFKIRETARFFAHVEDSRIDNAIDSILTIAAKQKGIIFDMREYPDWGGFVHTYIFRKFGAPPNRYADYYELNRDEIGTYIINDDPDTYINTDVKTAGIAYKGKVVIIVSPATLSQSEWNTMNLQHVFPQSITIGEQSAGADGDERMLMLPGGYKLNFTGNAIFYTDGTPAQRRGVKINKVMPLTPEQVISSSDYLYDEAIRLMLSIKN